MRVCPRTNKEYTYFNTRHDPKLYCSHSMIKELIKKKGKFTDSKGITWSQNINLDEMDKFIQEYM